MNAELGYLPHANHAREFGDHAALDKRGLRVRVYLTLMLVDSLGVVSGFVVGDVIRFGDPFDPAGLNILTALLPLFLVIAAGRRTYSADLFIHWRRTAARAVTSFLAAALLLMFAAFYLKASATMSRAVLGVALGWGSASLLTTHWLLHRYARRLLGGEPLSTLLICDGVQAACGEGAQAVDAGLLGLSPDIADPHALDRVGRLVKFADRVVIACPESRRAGWAALLKGANVRGELITPELAELGTLGADRFAAAHTLVVSTGPLDMRSRALKRVLDFALSFGALVMLSPLLVMIAVAIKLDSPGPVLFVQPRLGRGNRLFHIYKFRSMRTELCDVAGNQSTARDDKRITRVGRIIRSTSLDELPQILNVLRGDMSVVGPRPHALGSLAGDKLFWEVDQRYWHRHAAKPGLTGLAQVRGFRGATHRQADLSNRLQADLEYLNGWTIWRDLSILVATVKVVLHPNAY